ncbi:hypothetical protein [Lactobacillus sp. W8093]|uniref:phage upper tail fiber protein n=1 Tax=Lactobacillus sp. W8093 TaxID=2751038 RepID=UPI0018EFEB64|nr:hypothetical protein [Lactobacillus sp. W8093]MBI0110753.1 hypothetical protein [Lactobacillus sp. W8093]
MSKYNKTILTNAGLDLAAKASSGKTKFTITRAATSTEKLADESISELQQLTALPSLMQYGEINNVADSAQDKSIVIGTELIFNNKDLSTGYNINTIGLFAKEDGSDKEILYSLTTAVEPETMPDFKDKVLFKFNLTLFVVVGQKDNVTVNVTDNGVVSQKELTKAVQALPQKEDIANLFNKIDTDINMLHQTINTDIKNLVALNSDSGNNIYNTKINLDTFSTVGISKFLGCQLQSDGAMAGFDPTQGNLYGWIFDVPKWNGANTYEQIVYISDYGQGSLTYMRTKADATSKEDFFKVANDIDLGKIHTIANPLEVDNKTNPDSLTEPGIYFSKNGFNFAKSDIPNGYRSDGKTYMSVLEGENPGYTLNYFQQFMFQATKFNFECWYRAGYQYGSNAYYTVSFTNLKDIYSTLKQISVNGGTAVSPDDKGIANITVPAPDLSPLEAEINKRPLTVNKIASDSKGNVAVPIPDVSGIKNDIQNMQNQITSNALSAMKSWTGTLTQYQALTSYDPMTMYFIISEYEVVVK